MGTEAATGSRTSSSRRATWGDIQVLLEQLTPVDLRLLQWLLRYPFQRAEDLAIAMGKSLATVYRRISVQETLSLVESVMPGALGASTCRVYHLSNLGLHVLAAHEEQDPTILAQQWGSDERALLRLLPRLPMLVMLQDCINGLVVHAPEALAHRGRRSEVRWHWVRDYTRRFAYREKLTRCTADAGLILRIRAAAEDGTSREEQWYSLFVLIDAGIAEVGQLRHRLKRLLWYRECAERWPVYQYFPLVLVLVSTTHRMEHWQRCAGEAATAVQVASLTGACACPSAGHDRTISSPWRFAWKTLASGVPCQLQHLLVPVPTEAIPPGLLDDGGALSGAPAEEAPSSPPWRISRIICGNFVERAEYATRRRGEGYQDEREGIALLSLRLSSRHLALLDVLHTHPLLHISEMAALLDLQASSVERYLRELYTVGCIDPLATCVGQRWRLHERGLRLVAARYHLSIQSIAASDDEHNEASLVQRGQEVLLRHLEHTTGVYGYFASLSQAARQQRMQQREHRLLWWETGAFCERRYQDHDHWHNLRPDAMGEYQVGEQRVRFWLEWDRATMGTRDLLAKFRTYAQYVTSREWFRGRAVLPLLLVVAPDQGQEMRIARVVTAVLANTPGLVIRTTTITRLKDRGPLAEIWYQVLPHGRTTDKTQRCQFFDLAISGSSS